MSQHYFGTKYQNRPVTIQMGWDRPLQGYYMMVLFDDATEEDEFLYCNLDDGKLSMSMGLCESVDYFLEIIKSLNINLPESMVFEIKKDKKNNTGNRQVYYGESGEITLDSEQKAKTS